MNAPWGHERARHLLEKDGYVWRDDLGLKT
jgi:hypothetical protein